MNLSGHTYIEDGWRRFRIMAVHTLTLDTIEEVDETLNLRTLNRWLFEQAIESGEIKEEIDAIY